MNQCSDTVVVQVATAANSEEMQLRRRHAMQATLSAVHAMLDDDTALAISELEEAMIILKHVEAT